MIICGDFHLGKVQDCISVPFEMSEITTVPSRIADSIKRLDEIRKWALHNNDKNIVIDGDVFDSNSPDPFVIMIFHDWLKRCEHDEISVWVLPGNHDCGTSFHSLMFLKVYNYYSKYIRLIFTHQQVTIDDIKIWMFPHLYKTLQESIDSVGGFKEVYKKAGKQCSLLIGHAHPKGAKNSSDIEIEAGNAQEYRGEDFPGIELAVLGHIHKPQNFQDVVTTGSIVTCSFDEAKNEKGFVVVDKPGKKLRWKRILFETPETNYQHLKINLQKTDIFGISKDKLKSAITGKLLKVTVYAETSTQVDESKIRKLFNQYGNVVRFEKIVNRLNERSEEDTSTDDFESVDYTKALSDWLKAQDISKDKKLLAYKLGKRVIKEIQDASRA